jgi:hypothetical protein
MKNRPQFFLYFCGWFLFTPSKKYVLFCLVEQKERLDGFIELCLPGY